MSTPSSITPQQLTAVVDTREQTPLDLVPLQTMRATLDTGDYSIRGLERVVAIERKSLPDLLGCVGRQRARFEREVARLLAYPVRALVVESDWAEIERGDWRSELKPEHVIGSLLGWGAMGLPVYLVGDHERAGKYTARLLFLSARRRYREARALMEGTVRDDISQD